MTRKRWWELLAALALLATVAVTTYSFLLARQRDEALLRAVTADHHQRTVKLLRQGANPNARNTAGESPLLIAARRGNEATVVTLLEAGANPNQGDRYGATPLWWVAARDGQMPNRVRIAELLLKRGAEVNLSPRLSGGIPPLTWAAAKGNAGLVELLLQHRADPRFVASYGQTALKAVRQSLNTRTASAKRWSQLAASQAVPGDRAEEQLELRREAEATLHLLVRAGAVR